MIGIGSVAELVELLAICFIGYFGYHLYITLVDFNNNVRKIAENTNTISQLMRNQYQHIPNNTAQNTAQNTHTSNVWNLLSSAVSTPQNTILIQQLYSSLVSLYLNVANTYLNNFNQQQHTAPIPVFNVPDYVDINAVDAEVTNDMIHNLERSRFRRMHNQYKNEDKMKNDDHCLLKVSTCSMDERNNKNINNVIRDCMLTELIEEDASDIDTCSCEDHEDNKNDKTFLLSSYDRVHEDNKNDKTFLLSSYDRVHEDNKNDKTFLLSSYDRVHEDNKNDKTFLSVNI